MFAFFFIFIFERCNQKTLLVDVNGIDEGFLKGFPTIENNSSVVPDYILSATKQDNNIWFPACSIIVPTRPLHLYYNKSVTDETNVFIHSKNIIFNEKIFKFYYEKGLSIITDPNVEHRYVLSLHEESDELIPMPLKYSFIVSKRSVAVYQRRTDKSTNAMCYKVDIAPFYRLAKILAVAFAFLMIFRIYFYKLPINMNRQNGDRFWFMSSSKVALTNPPFIGLRNYYKLCKLIDAANLTKEGQHIVLGIKRTNDAVKIQRLDVYPFRKVYFVIYWTEVFGEIAEPMSCTLEGAELSSDDLFKVQKQPINVSYRNYRPNVDIDIPVSGRKGKLHIESNETNDLPFGEYSLHLGYIDCIHLSMINQISDLSPTMDAFNEFVHNIFVRLDYTSLNVLCVTKTQVEEVIAFYKNDELKPIVESFIRKFENDNSDFKHKITYKHAGQFRFSVNSFGVSSTRYYVIASHSLNALSLKMPEQTFHFIMSMLVTYHYSALSSRGNARSLTRIYNLIEETEVFSLIECVKQPNNFYRATGKLFGEQINQESFNLFFSNIPEDKVRALSDSDSRRELIQLPVKFVHTNGERKWVNISSITYYDKTAGEIVYTYLVEDITSIKKCSKKLKSVHSDVQIASEFLGLHKVQSDLTFAPTSSLPRELGYPPNIRSIRSLLYEEDNIEEAFKEKKEIKVKFASALGYSVVYTMMRVQTDGGYMVFAAQYLRQLRAISKCDKEKAVEQLEDDFIVIVYNLTTKKTKYADSLGKTIEDASIEEVYNFIAMRMLKEGKEKFVEELTKVYDEQENLSSFSIKLTTERKGYCWYKVTISKKFGTVMIFMRDVHAKKMNKIMMKETSNRANSFLEVSKIFYWVFSDTHNKENVYDKTPEVCSTVTIDWETLEKNGDDDAVALFERAVEDHSCIDSSIVFTFDDSRRYIIRGKYHNDTLYGVAIDINWVKPTEYSEIKNVKSDFAAKKPKIGIVFDAIETLSEIPRQQTAVKGFIDICQDCINQMKSLLASCT